MAEATIDFDNVIISWGKILPYFLIFVVNDKLLAPQLVFRNRYKWYFLGLFIVVFAVFGTIELLDFRYWQMDDSLRNKASLTELEWYWNVLFSILMAAANTMIKLYYRALDTEQRMAILERENIEQQMQYLKYQINPHFLMNTLNNIHAMIDFDTEMAKRSVMDLSRMLRHVLYDSGESHTTLDKEVEFLHNYIELMRIRYVDEVDIRLSVPDLNVCRSVKMPPLLLIVLIENAFQHGISYSKRSYIFVDVDVVDDELICIVTNSKHKTSSTEHSGIGMSNITKRLDLLFGNSYTLKIDDASDDQYRVKLVIPILK
jgi:LytS/YehU family sensor histidine kinase